MHLEIARRIMNMYTMDLLEIRVLHVSSHVKFSIKYIYMYKAVQFEGIYGVSMVETVDACLCILI